MPERELNMDIHGAIYPVSVWENGYQKIVEVTTAQLAEYQEIQENASYKLTLRGNEAGQLIWSLMRRIGGEGLLCSLRNKSFLITEDGWVCVSGHLFRSIA